MTTKLVRTRITTNHIHTHHFNGRFPGKPWLAGCLLDSWFKLFLS